MSDAKSIAEILTHRLAGAEVSIRGDAEVGFDIRVAYPLGMEEPYFRAEAMLDATGLNVTEITVRDHRKRVLPNSGFGRQMWANFGELAEIAGAEQMTMMGERSEIIDALRMGFLPLEDRQMRNVIEGVEDRIIRQVQVSTADRRDKVDRAIESDKFQPVQQMSEKLTIRNLDTVSRMIGELDNDTQRLFAIAENPTGQQLLHDQAGEALMTLRLDDAEQMRRFADATRLLPHQQREVDKGLEHLPAKNKGRGY